MAGCKTCGGAKHHSSQYCSPECRPRCAADCDRPVNELAVRDGTDCRICGDIVDMSLEYPDLRRASVDHILPVVHGGSHEPANCQLAHLICNLIKSDRYDGKSARAKVVS